MAIGRTFKEKPAKMPALELARKLESLEKKYDAQFKVVFDAIRQLMSPPAKPKREIGFHVKYDDDKPKSKKR